MTIIVFDGKTLASDKRACCNGIAIKVTKIRRIDGNLVGAAGDWSAILAMYHWFEKGADKTKIPDCQKDKDRWVTLLVIKPNKKIYKYEQDCFPYEVEEEKVAIGSGRDFALAAMEMGADAMKAVHVACKFDLACGNGIDTLEFT